MYSKSNAKGMGEGSYIPTNYRGNALYFERIPSEAEGEAGDCPGKSAEHASPPPRSHAEKARPTRPKPREADGAPTPPSCTEQSEGSPSLLSSILGSLKGDGMLVILLVLFFIMSGKDKEGLFGEDNTLLLLLLVLLL